MKRSDMVPLDQVIEEHRADPEFREAWDESEFARQFAIRVVRYRTENDLTQADLGALVGMSQPAIARLESGEETPTLKTLRKITEATGLEFHLAVAHGGVQLEAA